MVVEKIKKPRKPKPKILTRQRQQLVLDFIVEFQRCNRGLLPTFKQIAIGVGYASYGTVHHELVEPLIAAGWLERLGKGARMIVRSSKRGVYAEITDPALMEISKRQKNLKILEGVE